MVMIDASLCEWVWLEIIFLILMGGKTEKGGGCKNQNNFKMQQKVSTLMTVTLPGLIPPMDATFRVLIVQINISLKVE